MPVSVIVPTTLTNPACGEALESLVRAVAAVPGSEILVVANGPGPRLHPAVLDQAPIRVLQSPPGVTVARNVGIEAAAHPVVLLADDDGVVPPTWCTDLAGGLLDAGTAAAAAPVRVAPA